jgi:hypothetical protein
MSITSMASMLVVVFGLAVGSSYPAHQGKPASKLEFTYGQTTSTDSTNILDVGPVEENSSSQFELTVRNTSATSITLDSFATGSNLSSDWEFPEPDTGLKTRTTLAANEGAKLILAVQFMNPNSAHVDFLVQGQEIAALTVVYQIMSPRYCREIKQPGLPSAYGGGYGSQYSFCTLPALPGYEIVPSSVDFEVQTNKVSSHGRGCSGNAQGATPLPYTECGESANDKGQYCFTLKVQGHHKDGGFGKNPENQVIYVDSQLKATYQLIPPASAGRDWPRLLTVDAFDSVPKPQPLSSGNGESLSLSPNCQ